jgi:hypothetical protein
MRFKPPNCKRLQGAADARRRARRRPFFVLQVPDNKADAVSCERLRRLYFRGLPLFFFVCVTKLGRHHHSRLGALVSKVMPKNKLR